MKALIRRVLSPIVNGPVPCANCGETVDSRAPACWNCGLVFGG